MPLSLSLAHIYPGFSAAGRELGELSLIFIGRHWVFGLANALVTVLFGLILLRLASGLWPLRTNPALLLSLRRCVYLIGLFKGAFDLIYGDSLNLSGQPIGLGLQFPPLRHLIERRSHFSPLHPTMETVPVTLILCGLALFLFLLRAYRVGNASRILVALDKFYPSKDQRAEDALLRAARALRIPETAWFPKILLVKECASPLLIGVPHPRLLLSPRLVALLNDDELEMVLRHELAHFKRKDHWWRWIQLGIEDICRPILIGSRLGAYSVEMEELLCDRAAVLSPQDASHLAQAIAKAVSLLGTSDAVVELNDSVVPSLFGKHYTAASETASLNRRIQKLLDLSVQLSDKGPAVRRLSPLIISRSAFEMLFLMFLGLLLFGVLYARFHLILFNTH